GFAPFRPLWQDRAGPKGRKGASWPGGNSPDARCCAPASSVSPPLSPRPRARSPSPPPAAGLSRVSLADPPPFAPHLTVSWATLIALSFTHSRLLKHKAGPGVVP